MTYKPELLGLLLLGLFFCLYTFPIRDGDFFWHVKTGQWIWQHGALPTSDPFSYTVTDVNPFRPGSHRIQFILRQYWLGQLFLYALWNFAGEAGMVLLRATAYTGILAFLYWWMCRMGSGIIPLALLFLTGNAFRNVPNERPQLFAFVLMPLVLYCLEQVRPSLGGAFQQPVKKTVTWHWVVLPLLMAVWANVHASFLLGDVLLLCYAADHLLLRLLKKEPLSPRYLLLLTASAAITFANPNGYLPLQEILHPLPSYANTVYEHISPITSALRYHHYHASFWALLLLLAWALLSRLRTMPPAHLMILLALAGFALTGNRYIPFLFLATPLLAPHLPHLPLAGKRYAAAAALIVAWGVTADYSAAFRFGANKFFPAAACRFINETKPAGQLFNFYDWGGYLMLHSPRYKVFVDGRGLVEEVSLLHDSLLWQKDWGSILSRYDINVMVIPGVETYQKKALPVIYKLKLDDEWKLVYLDDAAMVFVRDIPANRPLIDRYAMDKQRIYEHIQRQWAWRYR